MQVSDTIRDGLAESLEEIISLMPLPIADLCLYIVENDGDRDLFGAITKSELYKRLVILTDEYGTFVHLVFNKNIPENLSATNVVNRMLNGGYEPDEVEEFIAKIDSVIALAQEERTFASQESEGDGELGNIAFAQYRTDSMFIEPDTSIESELASSLADYLEGRGQMSGEEAELIKTFLKNGQYSKVFHAPNSDKIYRGIAVSEDWLRTALNLKEDEQIPKSGSHKGDFTYKSKTAVSSWSTSIDVALRFAATNAWREMPWKVLLIANVSDNKGILVGPKGLYKLTFALQNDDEEETIALDNVSVAEIQWRSSKI